MTSLNIASVPKPIGNQWCDCVRRICSMRLVFAKMTASCGAAPQSRIDKCAWGSLEAREYGVRRSNRALVLQIKGVRRSEFKHDNRHCLPPPRQAEASSAASGVPHPSGADSSMERAQGGPPADSGAARGRRISAQASSVGRRIFREEVSDRRAPNRLHFCGRLGIPQVRGDLPVAMLSVDASY